MNRHKRGTMVFYNITFPRTRGQARRACGFLQELKFQLLYFFLFLPGYETVEQGLDAGPFLRLALIAETETSQTNE